MALALEDNLSVWELKYINSMSTEELVSGELAMLQVSEGVSKAVDACAVTS